MVWNKGLRGEEYLKHYKNKIGRKKGCIPWNKNKNHPAYKQYINIITFNNKTNLKRNKKISDTHKLLHKNKVLNNKGKNNPMYGRIGILNPKYGIPLSLEDKKKKRLARIKYIKKVCNNVRPNIGRQETQILNNMEQFFNYKIARQHFVEGYFVDGYIPELHLVLEVDERPKNRPRDIERENIIKNKLNCEFIRIPTYD